MLAMVGSCPELSFAQWQASAYIGAAHTGTSYLFLTQPTLGTILRFKPVGYRGESFRSPFYYGARIARDLSPHWAVEAELIHLKVFANVNRPSTVTGLLNGSPVDRAEPIDDIVQRFSISHGVNLILGNLLFRQPLLRSHSRRLPRLLLVLRLGAGTTRPHAESTIVGRANEHYQLGSPAAQFAAGVELNIFHRLYWAGEYKFTRTRQQVDVFQGKATSLLESHHVVTGPVIHF
jgi:hypothetical protein